MVRQRSPDAVPWPIRRACVTGVDQGLCSRGKLQTADGQALPQGDVTLAAPVSFWLH